MIEGLLLMIVLMASIVAFKEYLAREAGLKPCLRIKPQRRIR